MKPNEKDADLALRRGLRRLLLIHAGVAMVTLTAAFTVDLAMGTAAEDMDVQLSSSPADMTARRERDTVALVRTDAPACTGPSACLIAAHALTRPHARSNHD